MKSHYAYLHLTEGARQDYSLSIPPNRQIDTSWRSLSDILDDAERLEQSGVQELLLISQDTANYASPSLKALCQELDKLHIWIRLHGIYPHQNVDDIINLMPHGTVLPYLDMPLLHANHDILHTMQRPASAEKVIRHIEKWREIVPDIALRSTFVIGLLGESEAQFQELLDFVSEARFDRISAFTYSSTDGSNPHATQNKITEAIKTERIERLMDLQAHISAEKLSDKIGSIQPVIIDDIIIDDDIKDVALGRTIYDAPEIDGVVQIEDIYDAEPGQIVHVEIIDATDHDLIAVPA